MQSLMYRTDIARRAGSLARRLRSGVMSETAPKQVIPTSSSSDRTALVSWRSGSPAISRAL
jgi:hypothetical protein